MKRQAKKALVLSVGVTFILLGLIGLVLPVLQGILFLIIGFLLLSLYYPNTRHFINRHAEKYPHLFPIIEKVEKWIQKFVGEI